VNKEKMNALFVAELLSYSIFFASQISLGLYIWKSSIFMFDYYI